MLTAIILICSTTNPAYADCNRDNAVAVMRLPVEQSGNPATCFMHGQAYVAGTDFGQNLTPGETVKVTCAPSKDVEQYLRRRA